MLNTVLKTRSSLTSRGYMCTGVVKFAPKPLFTPFNQFSTFYRPSHLLIMALQACSSQLDFEFNIELKIFINFFFFASDQQLKHWWSYWTVITVVQQHEHYCATDMSLKYKNYYQSAAIFFSTILLYDMTTVIAHLVVSIQWLPYLSCELHFITISSMR